MLRVDFVVSDINALCFIGAPACMVLTADAPEGAGKVLFILVNVRRY